MIDSKMILSLLVVFLFMENCSMSSQSLEKEFLLLNQVPSSSSTKKLFENREMQAMKELVCTICESVTNSEFVLRRNYSEQNSNILSNEYSNRDDNDKFVYYNEYIQSCQDLLINKNICHMIDEDPNPNPFADTSSDDLKFLKVFKDILIHRLYITNSYNSSPHHHNFTNTKHHRRKRFLNQPILRPDDKDGTRRCNECDNDGSYCDMFNLFTYVLCGFPRILWDNFLGGTACNLVFAPISIRCFIIAWGCYVDECGFFNF